MAVSLLFTLSAGCATSFRDNERDVDETAVAVAVERAAWKAERSRLLRVIAKLEVARAANDQQLVAMRKRVDELAAMMMEGDQP